MKSEAGVKRKGGKKEGGGGQRSCEKTECPKQQQQRVVWRTDMSQAQ